jgi:hypothetical protein
MTIIGYHTCPVTLFVVTVASETNGLNYVAYNKKITITITITTGPN